MKWDREATKVQRYVVVSNFFSAAECDRMMEIRKSLDEHSSRIRNLGEEDTYINPGIRKSNTADWPVDDPGHINDLYRRVSEVNDQYFGFDVSGIEQPFNIIRYGPGDYFKPHADDNMVGGLMTYRKLTASIMMSDGSHIGGALRLYFGGDRSMANPVQLRLGKGDAVFFAPWVLHEVTEVITGNRYSLVTWLTGRHVR